MHSQVMQQAIQEKGWSEDLDEYKGIENSFNEAWNGYVKNSSHADHYRKMYDSMQKNRYLTKNIPD